MEQIKRKRGLPRKIKNVQAAVLGGWKPVEERTREELIKDLANQDSFIFDMHSDTGTNYSEIKTLKHKLNFTEWVCVGIAPVFFALGIAFHYAIVVNFI